jgi:hypothetical protein
MIGLRGNWRRPRIYMRGFEGIKDDIDISNVAPRVYAGFRMRGFEDGVCMRAFWGGEWRHGGLSGDLSCVSLVG